MRWRGWRSVDGHFGNHVARILVHDDDPVGHKHGFFDIVGHHQDRLGRNRFVQPELHQFAAQRFGGEHIQRRKRLVQAQQLRFDRHRAGEPDLLPHASRKLARIRRFETVEPDRVDQLHGARERAFRRDAAGLERDFDIFLDGQPGIEGEGLEHDRGVRIHAGQRLAAIEHHAGRGGVQSGDHPQERGLSAAGRAEQADKLAGPDAHVDIPQRDELPGAGAIGLEDAPQFEQARRSRQPWPASIVSALH